MYEQSQDAQLPRRGTGEGETGGAMPKRTVSVGNYSEQHKDICYRGKEITVEVKAWEEENTSMQQFEMMPEGKGSEEEQKTMEHNIRMLIKELELNGEGLKDALPKDQEWDDHIELGMDEANCEDDKGSEEEEEEEEEPKEKENEEETERSDEEAGERVVIMKKN